MSEAEPEGGRDVGGAAGRAGAGRLQIVRRFDLLIARLVAWLDGISLFSLLAYAGRLGLLFAVISFIAEYPKRQYQWQYQTSQTVESAKGKVHSRARAQALEALNGACVSLEGVQARGAALPGLELDRCYAVPGGGLLGRFFPNLFQRRGADLLGADLAGANLAEARLPAAVLRGAKLAAALLPEARLRGADLRSADLSGADLFYADLSGADLSGADLRGADLSHADLSGANLTRARLGGAHLVWADLVEARLAYADLTGADLAAANLHRADLYRAQLGRAVLRKVRIDQRTGLDGADLAGADLRGARLASFDPIRSAVGWERARFDPGLPPPNAADAANAGKAAGGLPVHPLALGLLIDDEQYFYQEIERGVRRAAAAAGARLEVRAVETAAARGVEHETALLAELTEAGADALLVVPQDEIRSAVALRRAWEAGVVLVTYDQALNPRDRARLVTLHYASSQGDLGEESGRWLGRWLRTDDRARLWGEVGIFRSCPFEGCYERTKGFRRALDAAGVAWHEVAYRRRGPGEATLAAATEILAHHPEIRVLWASSEDGTQGAVAAVRALGRTGQVRVVGTDLSPALQAMLAAPDGVLLAVTAQQPEEMGYRAATAALAALRGQDVREWKNGEVEHRLYARAGGR
jgi:uncharacterized protein YjbI with pentapeptide repeats/ABC-type sugar transport system substrate-binding protein